MNELTSHVPSINISVLTFASYFPADAKHTKLLLLLDSTLNVHVFPRTAESLQIVSKVATSIFFFLVDKENGELKGYMLLPEAEKSSFHVREMWNVKMPSSQQTITNIGNELSFLFLSRRMVQCTYHSPSKKSL